MSKFVRSRLMGKSRLGRMVRFGLVTLALLAAVEIGLRIYFRDHYTGQGPGGHPVWTEKFSNLNALGHRDHEFSVSKPSGTYRILVVGDAFTYGEGVESIGNVYTEVLEKTLNAASGQSSGVEAFKYEVLNVSQKVWEVDDYLSAIANPGLSYEPDLIVVGMYINDIEDRSIPRPKYETLPQRIAGSHWRLKRLLNAHSYLYWYTVTPYAEWKLKESWFDFVAGYVDPQSHDWERFVGFYEKIFQLGRDENIPIVVATFPYLVDLNDGHPFISTYERVAALARDNGSTAVNFFPIFSQYDIARLRAGWTRWLPSEEAHAIIAGELYQHLVTHELVPIDGPGLTSSAAGPR